MNFEQARRAHAEWKVRLRAFIGGRSEEKLNAVDVARDDRCELGKWIGAEARGACAKHPELLEQLRTAHRQFHASAAEVVKQATGNPAAMQALLGGSSAFSKASTEVNSLLIKIETVCSR